VADVDLWGPFSLYLSPGIPPGGSRNYSIFLDTQELRGTFTVTAVPYTNEKNVNISLWISDMSVGLKVLADWTGQWRLYFTIFNAGTASAVYVHVYVSRVFRP
jgi:hypothetical protein